MIAEEIITLARAGFTASQIAAIAAYSHEPEVVPSPVLLPAPAPAPAPAQAPAPVPASEQIAESPRVSDPLSQILSLLQQQNISQSSQPEPQSVDSILAEIINPPTKVR